MFFSHAGLVHVCLKETLLLKSRDKIKDTSFVKFELEKDTNNASIYDECQSQSANVSHKIRPIKAISTIRTPTTYM